VVANLYLRMNNDRLRLEREVLTHQNSQLHNRLYLFAGFVCILILLFFIIKGRRLIKLLRHDNMMLKYEKTDAERAIEDLNELSFYESKSELSLTDTVKINKLCNRLTNKVQKLCHKGVSAAFLTELPEDFEISTNADTELPRELVFQSRSGRIAPRFEASCHIQLYLKTVSIELIHQFTILNLP
jgi:hypothetical protein